MLPKKERLSRSDFNRFFSKGKRIRSTFFDLVYVPHPTFHGAVVISKKVASRAVLRNRLRRQAYSLLHELNGLHKMPGVYIMVLRRTSQPLTRTALKEELTHVFEKLSVTT